MVHKALDLAMPGDVVVVDAGGDLTNAMIGELMVGYAKSRGIAGIVINGAIRDCAIIGTWNFPVYAASVTHRGPYKGGPGEINVPIAFSGMVVNPGDLVLGDQDDLLCIGADQVEAILAATQKKPSAELADLEAIAAGRYDRSWVDQRLKHLGCDGV